MLRTNPSAMPTVKIFSCKQKFIVRKSSYFFSFCEVANCIFSCMIIDLNASMTTQRYYLKTETIRLSLDAGFQLVSRYADCIANV